eukprot:GHVL01022939.1.p1 GENE.GHVL01022939.1~~GHVL01022939.1.p1  ORF type:complete len:176 (+),score=36.00 GHVL01022939.1:39-566(+)
METKAINLLDWIVTNKQELAPPVGNKLLYGEGDLKVMICAGPNTRTDFHWENGPEWFYQIQGDMCLKLFKDNEFVDVQIKEGETYMLEKRIYHSPQRPKDTIGLVIERARSADEDLDRLAWFCPKCKTLLHEESFHCVDLGTQLKPVIEGYYMGDEARRTCSKCSWKEIVPEKYK